jgi:hypothetical protein
MTRFAFKSAKRDEMCARQARAAGRRWNVLGVVAALDGSTPSPTDESTDKSDKKSHQII